MSSLLKAHTRKTHRRYWGSNLQSLERSSEPFTNCDTLTQEQIIICLNKKLLLRHYMLPARRIALCTNVCVSLQR